MSFGSLIQTDNTVVNNDSSNWSAGLSSNVIPRSAYSLPEPQSNIQAANSVIPNLRGGRRKNNNNTRRIYMTKTKTKGRQSKNKNPYKRVRFSLATMRNKRRTRTSKGRRRKRMTKTKRRMRGGYMNNQAVSTTYSTGAYPNVNYPSALANPSPIHRLENQAYDNYNRNTNSWFNSDGS